MALYENETWGWDGQQRNIYGTYWYAQTFTPDTAHDITSIIIACGRVGSPGTITASIRATSDGKPVGGDLCVGTTDGNTLPLLDYPVPSDEEREITFSTNPTLSSGFMYAIVIRAISGSSSNRFYWLASTSSVYDDGTECVSFNSGSSWTLNATRELWFEEYGDEVETEYVAITGTLAGAGSLTGTLSTYDRLKPPSTTYLFSFGGTGNYYYRLLVQSDGSYGTHPADGGIEDTDYEVLSGYLPNIVRTVRRLVAVTRNSFYYEDI